MGGAGEKGRGGRNGEQEEGGWEIRRERERRAQERENYIITLHTLFYYNFHDCITNHVLTCPCW